MKASIEAAEAKAERERREHIGEDEDLCDQCYKKRFEYHFLNSFWSPVLYTWKCNLFCRQERQRKSKQFRKTSSSADFFSSTSKTTMSSEAVLAATRQKSAVLTPTSTSQTTTGKCCTIIDFSNCLKEKKFSNINTIRYVPTLQFHFSNTVPLYSLSNHTVLRQKKFVTNCATTLIQAYLNRKAAYRLGLGGHGLI